MNRNAKLASMMVLVAALAGCENVRTPVEPVDVMAAPGNGPSRTDLTGGLTVLSSTVAGLEELAVVFSAVTPIGDAVAAGDSLSVVVTDLLGLGGPSLNVAPSYNTSTTTTVEDGEPVTVSGNIKAETRKVQYSDGTSEWDHQGTMSRFRIKSKTTDGECKQMEDITFRQKAGPGTEMMVNDGKAKVVCPGEGRVYFVRVRMQTTFTPSGKAHTNVKETCVSRREDFVC